ISNKSKNLKLYQHWICIWIYESFKLGFLTLGYYWHFDIEQKQNF
ncbi:Uncharacterized protein APZ42_009834, partial [Daphnia magna]